jgi:DMSO reductase anchor subunit
MERKLEETPAMRGAPTQGDGRYIDHRLGHLSGEGSQIAVHTPDDGLAVSLRDVRVDQPGHDRSTYYGMPVLKAPVWRWYIPAYLYTGGLAGLSAWIGLASQLTGDRRMRRIVARTRTVSTVALSVSAALLVADLGRPGRFLNMLRVFRPTSPMNLGTWILSTAGAAHGAVWLAALHPRTRRFADVAAIAGGAVGLPMAGYTSVLLANTAVPLWQHTRRTLPPLFLASALASSASLLELFPLTFRERRAVRALAITGKAAELAAELFFESDAGTNAEVARLLHDGLPAELLRASRGLTAASLLLSIVAGRRRGLRVAAGVLGTLGAVALRFGVTWAGGASTRDPRATFGPERRRLEAREAPLGGEGVAFLDRGAHGVPAALGGDR